MLRGLGGGGKLDDVAEGSFLAVVTGLLWFELDEFCDHNLSHVHKDEMIAFFGLKRCFVSLNFVNSISTT